MIYVFSYVIIGLIVQFVTVISGQMDELIYKTKAIAESDGTKMPEVVMYIAVALVHIVYVVLWPLRIINDVCGFINRTKRR